MLKKLTQEEMEKINGGLRLTGDPVYNSFAKMINEIIKFLKGKTPEPTQESTQDPTPSPTSEPTGPTGPSLGYTGPDYSDPSSPPYPV